MTTAGDTRDDLIEQFRDTWGATTSLLASLEPAGWARPTDLPGWSVQDIVAHMIGTESMLAGRDTPSAPGRAWGEHVKNDIGALNEAWADSRRDRSPAEMLEEWRAITAERLEMLTAMTAEEFDAPSWTPVGNATYRRFMQIRVFDCWVHEQDIRRAVDQPGHASGPAAEASLDEIERSLGYIVGKKAKAPAGSRITFDLTGAAPRRLHVAVDERAGVVAELDRPADVTIHLGSTDFVALACGRARDGDVPVSYTGDEGLGAKVAGSLAFTI
ncbi:maleylpyruvate isomerase family mycothiol-dependent enzyme [Acidiferrimicrobium sp. IK]|uniref:maleylpyruvate isomerase family mycothiol-dependent enzyme n=1 Tax=Acidiferrimicrobium sp. IK TaxID=2871700 RepID=UPI0021CB7A4E|nr:maleylpyruvate isomerase family mycothiol-dependent enzyme [Acidiferrimicrobium sp. IK]MCU4182790.1 maleylpyruvate isomerase family mycothiol-dependent enzyme [Acidiferrimicrobium sp. IK]